MEEIERYVHGADGAGSLGSAIGAVRRAAYAYYEQNDQRYLELASD